MKKLFTSSFLILFLFQISRAQIPTIREVFNFDVGDEFHYSESNTDYFPAGFKKVILDKRFSELKDTVFYTVKRSNYLNEPSWDYEKHKANWELHYSTKTDVETYTHLDSSIFYYFHDGYFDPSKVDSSKMMRYDTLIGFAQNLCNKPEIGYWEQCCGNFEPGSESQYVSEGLGITWSSYISGGVSFQNYYSLRYFRKNFQECGTFDTIYSNVIENEIADFVITPTIAKNEIFINSKYPKSERSFLLVSNGLGQTVLEVEFRDQYTLNVRGLKPGFYYLFIKTDSNILRRKILVE